MNAKNNFTKPTAARMQFKIWALAAAILAGGLFNAAHADAIVTGSNYLQTAAGTSFNFGTGAIAFNGSPLDTTLLGLTDTIIERTANANLVPGGPGATVPISVVALSLKSQAPVNIGGVLFNVFVNLNSSPPSTGTATIFENASGNGGTFTSNFTENLVVTFVPVSGGSSFTVGSSLTFSGSGAWTNTPPAGAFIKSGPIGDLTANVHSGLPGACPAGQGTGDCMDFFISGQFDAVTTVGQHVVGNALAVPQLALEVPVDIRPTSCPNPLNVGEKGVLPVAILGTSSFDVTKVDPASVRLEGVAPLRSALEDVGAPFTPFTGKKDCLKLKTVPRRGLMASLISR